MKWLIPGIAVSMCLFSVDAQAQTQATYNLTFEGRWTGDLQRPGNAHFSPLVGAVHNDTVQFWSGGAFATTGVENVAETGNRNAFFSFVDSVNTEPPGGRRLVAGDSFASLVTLTTNPATLITRDGNVSPEQTVTIQFQADDNQHLLTMLTMIAPSPDWFIGFHDLNLKDSEGNWRDGIVLDVNSYDAGTESGIDLALSGPTHFDTNDPIQILNTAEPVNPFSSRDSLGQFRIDLVSVVPEPGSLALLGLSGVALLRRRR